MYVKRGGLRVTVGERKNPVFVAKKRFPNRDQSTLQLITT